MQLAKPDPLTRKAAARPEYLGGSAAFRLPKSGKSSDGSRATKNRSIVSVARTFALARQSSEFMNAV